MSNRRWRWESIARQAQDSDERRELMREAQEKTPSASYRRALEFREALVAAGKLEDLT